MDEEYFQERQKETSLHSKLDKNLKLSKYRNIFSLKLRFQIFNLCQGYFVKIGSDQEFRGRWMSIERKYIWIVCVINEYYLYFIRMI